MPLKKFNAVLIIFFLFLSLTTVLPPTSLSLLLSRSLYLSLYPCLSLTLSPPNSPSPHLALSFSLSL